MSPPASQSRVPLRWTGRASWSGCLTVGSLTVPVQAYPRLRPPAAGDLHSLHAGCGERLRMPLRCPQHGDVSPEEVVKGVALGPRQYLVLGEQELAQLRPVRATPMVHCTAFLEPAEFDLALLAGRSYLLLPHGPASQRPYATLADALDREGVWTVGLGVLFGKEQATLVRPTVPGLVLELLHDPMAVRPPTDLTFLSVALDQTARLALGQLIQQRPPLLAWAEYRDRTAERLRALVQERTTAVATDMVAPAPTPASSRRLRRAAVRQPPARRRRTTTVATSATRP